jgi:hypothetical protein
MKLRHLSISLFLLVLTALSLSAQEQSVIASSESLPFPSRLTSVLDGFHGITLKATAPTATASQRFFIIELKLKRPDQPSNDSFGQASERLNPDARYVTNPIHGVLIEDKRIELAGSKTPNVEAIAMIGVSKANIGWLITKDTTISLAYIIDKNVKEIKVHVAQDRKTVIYTVKPVE